MTGPAPRLASSVASPSGTGLLERLLAVVRPSFRADVLVFEAADAVFGGAVCLVTDCARAARSQGLCQGHHLRWKADGGPDVTVFAASTDPRWRRQQPNTGCRVDGDGYASQRTGCVCCTSSGGGAPGVPICRPGSWIRRP